MKVCIHRGTQEVGGTCVEIESQGKRITLDVGLPLEAADSIGSCFANAIRVSVEYFSKVSYGMAEVKKNTLKLTYLAAPLAKGGQPRSGGAISAKAGVTT